MSRRLVSAAALFLAVQYRSGFVHVYLGAAAVTIGVVRFLVPGSWHAVVVPVLLLGEYGTMGVFMVAAESYLARNEGSNEALRVTPLSPYERVGALVLAPALVAIVAGCLVFVGIFGVDARLAYLLAPLAATTVLAGSVGLILASRYQEFTRFLLGSIPVITVFSLPYLAYFELVPRYTFAWLPWDAALFAFDQVIRRDLHNTFPLLVAEIFLFAGIGLWCAAKLEASPA